MPHGGNFNPEWGYLAPRPGFIRTLRAVLLAGAIGTVAGMTVAVTLVARPAADVSVAARTMAQPNLADASSKSASANEMLLQDGAQHVAPPPQVSASSGVDHRDLKDLAVAESRSAATIQQHTSVAALAEAPAVSDNLADKSGGMMRPSAPRNVSRVEQQASVASLAEAPAWRDDASEISSEAVAAPSPKRTNRKAQVARVRTPHNDPHVRGRQDGPLAFFPMIGRTILGANPFWND
jgi:hypothetical protein